MTRQTVARKLKQIRQDKGLKQSDVAKKAGISTNYYARVERADVKPSLEVFEDIIKALGVHSTDVINF
jgi:transcriptional regulator with XRE-family HTH domain